MASLDVVIVNWNTGALLEECVRSVIDADRVASVVDRIVVVDNASTDGSLDAIRGLRGATVMPNRQNVGFAAACNQGAAGSRADCLLFLNPDTRVTSAALREPVDYLSAPGHAATGVCGVRLVDAHGHTMPSSRRFPSLRIVFGEVTRLSRIVPARFPSSLLPQPDRTAPIEVDQLIGAFFVVRRSLFESLGGFDRRFFVYYEEVDFSWRARQAGYSSVYLPSVHAIHHGEASSVQVKGRRLFYLLRSRALYARKHWSVADRLALALVTVAVEFPARVVWAALRLSPQDTAATLEGFARLGAWTLSGRRGGP